MIEVINLTKSYNSTPVVDSVNFKVESGETMVLLGSSGSGKTTTLKMINRLIEPTSGRILLDGEDVSLWKVEELRRKMGFVIQNIGLFPHYTIEQNIALVPTLLKWDEVRTQKRVKDLLAMLDLKNSDLLGRYPSELSGGQQQRIGIARALAADPPVVLLDEPFGALDPITRQQIHNEFCSWETIWKKTMILVTHDVNEALALGDKICLLHDGRVQQLGVPRELIFRPANQFVKDFFDSQRFQLELKVVNLADLVARLPQEPEESAEQLRLNQDVTLWEALDSIEKSGRANPRVIIQNQKGEMLGSAYPEDLLSAFYQWKGGSKHG